MWKRDILDQTSAWGEEEEGEEEEVRDYGEGEGGWKAMEGAGGKEDDGEKEEEEEEEGAGGGV